MTHRRAPPRRARVRRARRFCVARPSGCTAVTISLPDPRHPQALHYREWFALLEQNGYAVAGKDPLAVFLTQLSRSPVVQRGTQSGVYELNAAALADAPPTAPTAVSANWQP